MTDCALFPNSRGSLAEKISPPAKANDALFRVQTRADARFPIGKIPQIIGKNRDHSSAFPQLNLRADTVTPAVCVGGQCRRSVSPVSVYATYATYATYAVQPRRFG